MRCQAQDRGFSHRTLADSKDQNRLGSAPGNSGTPDGLGTAYRTGFAPMSCYATGGDARSFVRVPPEIPAGTACHRDLDPGDQKWHPMSAIPWQTVGQPVDLSVVHSAAVARRRHSTPR